MAKYYSRAKLDLSDTTNLLAHFWSKVARCDHGPNCDTCGWLWQAGLVRGYGEFHINRKNVRAHRFIYRMTYGEILPGLHVCHRCDVPTCVNPQHLWLGTNADNMRDAIAKGRAHLRTSGLQKKLYADHPEYVRRGEKVPSAKLTDTQVLAIRRAYQHGQTQRSLARQFGVSHPTIHHIIHRRAWRHLPEE